MAIQPVNLPTAAGIDYGNGDVRHFSPGDAVGVPSLQNPTRHLAQRDNLVAEKLNEVIQAVNSQEQMIPMPVVRTLLTPNEEVTVYNYRIPAGFESRIINAAISATPTSADIELKVYYSASFGGVTGSEIISTATEFSGGVQFYTEGEFIVALKNKSAVSLELAASLLLTMRPLGSEGALLVAATVQGDPGDPGPTGPPGPQGQPGAGGEGSPGMVWTGPYSAFHVYVDKEVASYDLYGTLPSSFIARTTMVGVTPDDSYPINDGRWEAVAIGAAGPAGTPGTPGPAGGAPTYYNTTVTGTLITGEDWMAGTSSFASFYTTTLLQASRSYSFAFQQAAVVNSGTDGLAFIMASSRLCCTGHGTIYLPLKAGGGLCNYTNNNVHINVMSHGTLPVYINPLVDNYGTSPSVIVNTTSDGSGYAFAVLNPTPTNIAFSLFGAQQVVP